MTAHDEIQAEYPLQHARVGIVGLGLMGGSLAMALRGHVAELVGIERQAGTRQIALHEGIVDIVLEELTPTAQTCDLLVLATPVRTILDTLGRLPDLRPGGCPVLDLGSTKRAVIAAMDALPPDFSAIGGHPLCGKETAGLAAASADLYQGQTFVLCPSQRTTAAVENSAIALIETIGARPMFLDAAEHDTIVARVSHLPALISVALMRTAADEHSWAVSASGFRDVSRLSGSDPRMILDILLTNREAVLEALAGYEDDLATMREALDGEDEDALLDWLVTAQLHYASYRRFKSAAHLLPPSRRFSGRNDVELPE